MHNLSSSLSVRSWASHVEISGRLREQMTLVCFLMYLRLCQQLDLLQRLANAHTFIRSGPAWASKKNNPPETSLKLHQSHWTSWPWWKLCACWPETAVVALSCWNWLLCIPKGSEDQACNPTFRPEVTAHLTRKPLFKSSSAKQWKESTTLTSRCMRVFKHCCLGCLGLLLNIWTFDAKNDVTTANKTSNEKRHIIWLLSLSEKQKQQELPMLTRVPKGCVNSRPLVHSRRKKKVWTARWSIA